MLSKKLTSITARLFFASALLLPVFLGVTGFFLDRAFQTSLITAEKARLQRNIYLLYSAADLPTRPLKKNEKPRLIMPKELRDKDFERINSGLYAYLFNDKKELVWQSNSTSLQTPPTYDQISPKLNADESAEIIFEFENENYFIAYSDIFWEVAKNREVPFRFVAVHDSEDFIAEKNAYRNQLWQWLGAVGILLLIAQTAILRWGLSPLKKLAVALNAMQSGDTRDIEGDHPDELQDIVDNLNQVLAREQALRQRYRNSLSDLAHSLKTPLAVMQAKLSQASADEELQQLAAEQVSRMNQVVTYQLQRAVSSQQQGSHQRSDLEPIVRRLLSALQKVYASKGVQADCELAAHSIFAGDEQDLMEVIGNITENAFKYGKSRVHVRSETRDKQLLINISDDGPGVPAEQQTRILERGHRLDTSLPGQGIGLSVAADIIHSYGGKLHVGRSSLGGAEFQLVLPLAS
ncbi:two-component sensor histidine kinase [Cellvibrio zantedeschiae]|uniref:histidine kinase n=1 Tax=Cellvibrio zantedeschiae TaxID=1237077 RepID=A0ABQ3AQN1_9GAMM|nr:two-component sensor histidine kinase [Cellvibrio zantedeschiae]